MFDRIYHIAPKRSGHAWVGHMIKSWCPDSVYHDMENCLPENVDVPIDGSVIVLQIRDLLNWYASYIQRREGKFNRRPIQAWHKTAKEFHQTLYLENYRVVKVMYDTFFDSKTYREYICAQLGGKYTEKGLNKIKDNGRGSSFDGMSFDGRAQNMSVLTRYLQVDPVHFVRLFKEYSRLKEFYLSNMSTQEKRNFVKSLIKN